jgi:hypothetical protein
MATFFQEAGGVSAYEHRPVALVQQVLLLRSLDRIQALALLFEAEGIESRSRFLGEAGLGGVPQRLVVQDLKVSNRLGKILRQLLVVVPHDGRDDGQDLGFQTSLRALGPILQVHIQRSRNPNGECLGCHRGLLLPTEAPSYQIGAKSQAQQSLGLSDASRI